MTTIGSGAEPRVAAAGGDPAQLSRADPAPRGRADAALLVARVRRELDGLAALADDVQRAIGPHVAAAALADPSLMRQAQALDLLTQSLSGLSSFLARIGDREIGREALDFEGAASAVGVGRLGDRLAGRDPSAPTDDVEFF